MSVINRIGSTLLCRSGRELYIYADMEIAGTSRISL